MIKTALFRIKDKILNIARKKSPWVLHYECGGCNGCSIETFACLSPRYDVERFGMQEKGNPRHSDVFAIAGTVTAKNKDVVDLIYHQMSKPKVVVAIGACAISKGIFHDAYNSVGPVDKIIPVDIYVPGCPPKPEAIMDGIIKAIELLETN
ncbi:MAG: NADH-quinone oxidoreductase subunit NuoB [DPANN group archaeon]|nr:NADH-quinone oxidoreductase subunit NuoB [DPANN group archaeon]